MRIHEWTEVDVLESSITKFAQGIAPRNYLICDWSLALILRNGIAGLLRYTERNKSCNMVLKNCCIENDMMSATYCFLLSITHSKFILFLRYILVGERFSLRRYRCSTQTGDSHHCFATILFT